MLDKLKGWKTYITAIAAILAAIGAHLGGSIDLTAMIAAIFAAVQTMNIRHSITTTVSEATGKLL